jgi:hypothetical protein
VVFSGSFREQFRVFFHHVGSLLTQYLQKLNKKFQGVSSKPDHTFVVIPQSK